MKRCPVVLACVALAAIPALAECRTNTVVNGISDWTLQASYVDTSFVPGEGDVVVVPADCEVFVSSKTQNDFISKFLRIRPESPTSRIVFTVPTGETWDLLCAVTKVVDDLRHAGGSDFANGEVVKRGGGTLLVGGGNRLVYNLLTGYDCWTGWTVEEGLLKIHSEIPAGGTTPPSLYLGYLTVSNNAVFQLGSCDVTNVRGLFGGGLVTNAIVNTTFQNMGTASQRTSRFTGRFEGAFSFSQYGSGRFELLGTNNAHKSNLGSTRIANGEVVIRQFGKIGDAHSGLGLMNYVTFNTAGKAQLTYEGDADETTDRGINVTLSTNYPAVLSGGHHGGVTFTGDFSFGKATSDHQSRTLVFSGSNEVACVMDGTIYGCYRSGYDCLYYAKEGSGSWRFTQHGGRVFPSGFAIREGTLQFDSLYERGLLSSLGTATNLTDGSGFAFTPQVDYAFKLGSETDGKADAVFEYTGTNSAECATRPLALAGDGHLRNSTARRFRFAGVSSLAAGKTLKTLTLDGSGLNTNEVADVSDGSGKTGVTKAGTGTWCLSGDQTFSGPLKVESGTLVVRQTLPGPYTWFRWTIKDKLASSTGTLDQRINVNAFSLFDSTGNFQTTNLVENVFCSELAPGEFGFQTDSAYSLYQQAASYSGSPDHLFIKATDYGFNGTFYPPKSTTASRQVLADSSSWVPLVLRLPAGAKEIASFDYMNTWGTGGNAKYGVRVSSLEGSVDGLHWNVLTNELVTVAQASSWTWSVSQTTGWGSHKNGASVAGSTTKTYSLLENVASVSVAAGAKLVAEGSVTISHLVVDAVHGMGTIDGAAFAASGAIDLESVTRQTTAVSADLSTATGLENIRNWAVSVNGTDRAGYRVAASATGLKIIRPGLTIFVK